MGLFDIFTGKPAKEAAQKQQNYLNYVTGQGMDILGGAETRGLEALRSGYGGAAGAITPAFQQARQDIMASTDPAIAALTGGTGQSAEALTSGRDQALSALQSGVTGAVGAYDPLAALGQNFSGRADLAGNMAQAALGLGGPQGSADALAAFRSANPGYDFQVSEALNAAMRGANVGGAAAGGNVLQELSDRTRSIADTTYGNWYDRLFGREQLYAPLGANATAGAASGQANALLTGGTGAANIYTGTGQRLSDLYGTQGRDIANVYGNQGRSLAELAARGGTTLAELARGQGASEADLISRMASGRAGILGSSVQPMFGTYDTMANADLGASNNIWKAIGSGISTLAGLPMAGGGSVGGSVFGSIFPKKA